MKKHLTILFILISGFGYSQTTDQNYTKSTTYKIPTATSITSPDIGQANVQISYFDGLGRPIQTISHAQSNAGNDIVSHIEYDAFGRQTKQYLPYASSGASLDFYDNALSETAAFYNTPEYDNTANPYSETELENSPLNRVLKQAAPGNPWALGNGHEIKLYYGSNTIDEVQKYKAITNFNVATNVYDIELQADGFYPENELYKNSIKDENTGTTSSNQTEEFKDKSGKLILKRIKTSTDTFDTYYVYDDYNNLTYVLPPLYNPLTAAGSNINGICYQYKYDNKNRLVAKKMPDKQWEYIVYDQLGRIRATGPTQSPFTDIDVEGWLFIKYDAFSRPILTAWQASSLIDENKRITLENNIASSTELSENIMSFSSEYVVLNEVNGIVFGHTNDSYPTSAYHILTVNYYDHYNYPNAPTDFSSVLGQNLKENCKTLSTGSWVRILENSTDAHANTSYSLYKEDRMSSPIKAVIQYTNGGFTQTESEIDFGGKVLQAITTHLKDDTETPVVTTENFVYSPQGRIKQHTHQIDDMDEEDISLNEYNELGTLITKKVGELDSEPLQEIDYSYNIRGWLTNINNIDNLHDLEDLSINADVFAFRIIYNPEDTGAYGVGGGAVDASLYNYNGNIAQTLWLTNSDNNTRSYTYNYDGLNRLLDANYSNLDLSIDDSFNESLTYDKNGNILSLARNGSFESATTTTQIDNLTYFYEDTSPNQLKKVVDLSNSTQGFKDDASGTIASDSSDDYNYDDYGNMISDQNKNIDNIIYNHLNLPTQIDFHGGTGITYTYNATGVKLEKVVDYKTHIVTTNYSNGYQYEDKPVDQGGRGYSALQFFPHAEGYVKAVYKDEVSHITPKFQYVYNYTDHLGNIRMSFTNDRGEIKKLEETHYYPFGLKHGYYNSAMRRLARDPDDDKKKTVAASSDESIYKYLYNGKELQDELGLNMYAMDMRQYDPAIARWVVQDPVIHHSKSPYNAFDNNPVYWADPSGADAESFSKSFFAMSEWLHNDKLPGLFSGGVSSGISMDIYQDGGGGSDDNIDFSFDDLVWSAWNKTSENAETEWSPDGNGGFIEGWKLDEVVIVGNRSGFSNEAMQEGADNVAGQVNDYFAELGTIYSTILQPPRQTDSFDGFWGGMYHAWTGGNENGGRYNWNGNLLGLSPHMGTVPFIGGPLRKGQSAEKLGKYLFNPSALHVVKEGVLKFANPKNFSHIVGSNPNLMFKGGKIWLTGVKSSGYYGKSYETGMTITNFLSLF